MAGHTEKIRLVVNADDFGYFDEVSRGIIDVAVQGRLTATGVMANGPALDRWVDKLKSLRSFSVGVHLNATLGEPLTASMRQALRAPSGLFPGQPRMVAMVLRGQVKVATVMQEWRAQIQRCLQAGLELRFLNSHEHIHMLPQLYPGVRALAREFDIAHVRRPRAEWGPGITLGGLIRNGAFTAFKLLLPRSQEAEPVLIGLNCSGKLDLAYCGWRFARLARNASYELMCHPGWSDPLALTDPKLAGYHAWEQELHALMSPQFAELLRSNGIDLVPFSGLN